jgi:small subunit ribosomal protein S4
VSQYDIIDIRPKSSVETVPVPAGAPDVRRPPGPGLDEGRARQRCEILIHQLPVREQIDTVLTEQLIVELYSKN